MGVLQTIATEIRADPAFAQIILSDPNILGVDKISGREIVYALNLRVRPNQRDGVLRELRKRIVLTFEQSAIPLGSEGSLLVLAKDPPAQLTIQTPAPPPEPTPPA